MKLQTLTNLQRDIFYHVQKKTRSTKNWVEELARVLDKSKNSVYKKISGQISLSLRELLILAEHYELQLDPIIHGASTVTFTFPLLIKGEDKPCSYLQALEKHLARYDDEAEVRLWYAGTEFPFVHGFNFPEITAFKFYIYQKTIWQNESYRLKKFAFDDYLVNPDFINPVEKLLSILYRMPSIEFWNSMILDVTLSQIKYVLESGLFEDPLDASILCTKLLEFVDHMQYSADFGIKKPVSGTGHCRTEFTLYHNEVTQSNNLIFLECPEKESVYLGFANPQYLFTEVKSAITYSRKYFDVLQHNSQMITKESRKSRLAFFNDLRRKIQTTVLEINTILKVQKI